MNYIRPSSMMINELMTNFGFSTAVIAQQIGICERTVYRLQKGTKPSIRTEIRLVSFYCFCSLSLKQTAIQTERTTANSLNLCI